jgi:hypothetical protein
MKSEKVSKLFIDKGLDIPYFFEDRDKYKIEDNFTRKYGTGVDNIKIIENWLSEKEIQEAIRIIQKYEIMSERTHCYPLTMALGFNQNDYEHNNYVEKLGPKMVDAAKEIWKTELYKDKACMLMVHPVNTYLAPHTDILDIDYVNNDPDHDEGPSPEEQINKWDNMWSGHVSILVYLNDDYDDGYLYFPQHDYYFKPKRGSLVTFPGSLYYVHGVTPITSGTRYTISQWAIMDIMRGKK